MHNYIRSAVALAATTSLMGQAVATPWPNMVQNQTQSTQTALAEVCTPAKFDFDYFNGIMTTPLDADANLQHIMRTYGERTPTGEKISYHTLYNLTVGFASDVLETFDQRMKESDAQAFKDRYELFWETTSGTGRSRGFFYKAWSGYQSLEKGIENAITHVFYDTVVRLQTAAPDIARHRELLDRQISQGSKILMLAHSEGNLFGNLAYDYVLKSSDINRVKMVHVAPASPSLRGPYTLSNKDWVIIGVRLPGGSVPVPNVSMEGYDTAAAGADALGHGLKTTYMNPKLPTSANVNANVYAAMVSLASGPVKEEPYFFKVTMTSTRDADLDLNVIEPNGVRTWYGRYMGEAGYLDPIAINAGGTKIYYASCQPEKVQLGVYKVGYTNANAKEGTPFSTTVTLGGRSTSTQFVVGKPVGFANQAQPTLVMSFKVKFDPISKTYEVEGL